MKVSAGECDPPLMRSNSAADLRGIDSEEQPLRVVRQETDCRLTELNPQISCRKSRRPALSLEEKWSDGFFKVKICCGGARLRFKRGAADCFAL
ncbi:hypothetical protein PBY51_018539 [Eleginops maclovinus]|uniref:Uncharacterized protein n=1 Tax=Eleginops maclovinus TaxID=56733 RepID=A0AAN8AYA3_ELEMC|nr:hypothetical protein PBY51_018539 [Eleginops maclovinus]